MGAPTKGPTRRQVELGAMKSAGYHDDARAYVRLMVERRTASGAALKDAWAAGVRLRRLGHVCTCFHCERSRDPNPLRKPNPFAVTTD